MLKLVVDNSQSPKSKDQTLKEAVEAYWRAARDFERARDTSDASAKRQFLNVNAILDREDAALRRLMPLRTRSPRDLAQKLGVLEKMIETERAPEQLAEFAASIASDALSMSRGYLNCAG